VSTALRVGIVGCGLIGGKRAQALGADRVVAAFDVAPGAAQRLVAEHGGTAVDDLDALLDLKPDVVVVATSHDQLAGLAERALAAGAHVLVEKPAGVSLAQVDALSAAAERAGRLVKVGFNHRFHPGIARAAEEVHSGRWGEALHVRGRYGHGGRVGYDREWRAEPARSGGGELIDQGMHLIDLTHWLLGPLPLHSALLRTQFWDTPVDDNAALLLGESNSRTAPWATLHVSWTEWKNLFSLEIYCRTAKLHVEGLVRSYGPQRLRIFAMKPELGPPDVEEISYGAEDGSWQAEWENLRAAVTAGDAGLLRGDLADARYAWQTVEAAYEAGGYAGMRAQVGR
jgi:predicted dehydrogenase